MKQSIKLIFLFSALSISVVAVLHFRTETNMNLRYNSFDRTFINDFIQLSDTTNIDHNSYYIAGHTEHTIYLANPATPGHLLITNTQLKDTTHTMLTRMQGMDIDTRIKVDSPYFHLINGREAFVYTGTLTGSDPKINFDKIYFTEATPISPYSFALVAIASNTRIATMEKKVAGNPRPQLFPNLLEKQVDGIFCTDGMLHYNKDMSQLIYLYFYRNQYLAMDTNLNLLYRGNTIDTVSRAKIRIGENIQENSLTMQANKLIVNKQSTVYSHYMFVNSNLLARNEDVKRFQSNSVIDVYDLQLKSYLFSFYIPPYRNRKVRYYAILDDNTLLGMYGSHLVTYKLSVGRIENLKEVKIAKSMQSRK